VLLSIPVYPEFDNPPHSNPVVGVPSSGERVEGGHSVFAAKYDAVGVWIENSWGPVWGNNGWGELTWGFVDNYANEGWTVTSVDRTSANLSDDFGSYGAGSVPSAWMLRGTNGMSPEIDDVGGGNGHVLQFPGVSGQYWDRWAIKNGFATDSTFTETVELHFTNSVADRAGLTLAWDDATWHRIDIQPNVYWDNIEFRTTGFGSNLTVTGSAVNRGGLTINAGANYWLRVKTSTPNDDDGKIVVSWSTDGSSFTDVLTAEGPSLSGRLMQGEVGVGTAGPNMPQVWFDNLTVTDN